MHVFLKTKFNDCLIWQVVVKVAAELSCIQVRSHNTIFNPIYPCDMLSVKILWCELKSRIQKSFLNRLAFYFHQQSDENRIMRSVKEIRYNFNWRINLVNILWYACSLIKSVFVILFISYFPNCSVSPFATFQKNYKKNPIVFDMSSVISILPSSCVTQTSIYLN
jgi:hypothetical protein